MYMHFFHSPIKYIKRNLIRSYIRGYLILKKENRLFIIDDLLSRMRQVKIVKDNIPGSSFLFGSAVSYYDLIIRQRTSKINHVLVISLLIYFSGRTKRIICPLPREWSLFLLRDGYPVSISLNNFLWSSYCIFRFLSGFKRFFYIISCFFSLKKNYKNIGKPFVFLINLHRNNFPSSQIADSDCSLIDWLSRNLDHLDTVRSIHHSVKDVPNSHPSGLSLTFTSDCIPPLFGLKAFLLFLLYTFKYLIISFYWGIQGRWWFYLMFVEFLDSQLIKLSQSHRLARSYWFNNGFYYPPLWTYYASERGSKILMYFYSTNSEPWIQQNDILPPSNMYSLMNWPSYLVWDEYQCNVVKNYSNPTADIKIVGPISFSSTDSTYTKIVNPSVGVFDVQPHRLSQYAKYGLPFDYYVPSVAISFLSDIHDVSSSKNVNFVYKTKRNIGRLIHPRFRSFLNSFLQNGDVQCIPSEVSAFELIEQVDIVISYPFTSVAIAAMHIGKPVVYYDPIGIVKINDPAAHGVSVIRSKFELSAWFDENLMN